MARKFGVAIDLQKNELQNARVQNIGGLPSSPVAGLISFDSTPGVNTLFWYDGTGWVAAKSGAPSGAAGGVLSGTYPNPGFATDPFARANHTGTQLASTISNFDTQVRTSKVTDLAVPTTSFSMNSQKITNLADPTAGTDAATKNYVDNTVAGLAWKDSVRVLVQSNVNIASPGTTLDGVTMATGDRVLLIGQTTGSQNGPYVFNGSGSAMTRATDADTAAELGGMAVFVEEGTSADTAWTLTTNAPITVGTTSLAYAQFTGAASFTAGNGLSRTGNQIDVGAGTGISVAADTVSVNTAVVPRTGVGVGVVSSFTIGDGAATFFAVTHNLGTRDVLVNVYTIAAPYETVETDVERTDANTVTIRFASAPAAGAYRVVVIG
jgi:hypothetical protein